MTGTSDASALPSDSEEVPVDSLWNVGGGNTLVALVVVLAVAQLFTLAAWRIEVIRRKSVEKYLGKIEHVLVETPRGDLLAVKSYDRVVGRSLILSGEWEAQMVAFVDRVVQPGMTVVELGANYGCHTLPLARKLKNGHLYTFEANPHVARLLEMSLRLADAKNVTLFRKAAYSENTMVQFNSLSQRDAKGRGQNFGHSHILTSKSDERGELLSVEAVRVDDVLADLPRVDLFRIDIEGAELPALKGATRLLDRSPDAPIIMEWAPEMMAGHGDVKEFLRSLRERSYRIWRIMDERTLVEMTDEALLQATLIDLYVARKPLTDAPPTADDSARAARAA